MKTATFKSRVEVHDNLALPAVDYLFELMGYKHFELGIEREKKKFRDALKNRNDLQALKIRFSPDRFYSRKMQDIVICEVKSEYLQHKNFAIEFDSYLQAVKYSEDGYLYAFVDITSRNEISRCSILFCMAVDIPTVKEFILPSHHPMREMFISRIEANFPKSSIILKERTSGSGTPFFLLPKDSDFLVSPNVYFDTTKDFLPTHVLFDSAYERIDDQRKALFRLPLLEAFDYLYKNNLTIDDLWTVTGEDGLPQTNITTKPTLHPKT